MIIPHHTYSSVEPIFDNYLLCMDAYTQSMMTSYCLKNQFIVTLIDKETLNKFDELLFDFSALEGYFLSDKYWKNDTTLRCVFTSLFSMNLNVGKNAADVRTSMRRKIAFMEFVIKQDGNVPIIYPLPAISYENPDKMYFDEYPQKDPPQPPYFMEDMPFYVKELDAIHSIRFGFGQYYTLKMNYSKDSLWYDTLYSGVIDTMDYPSYVFELQEDDTSRFTYHNVSYNMYPGIANYQRTIDGNIIVLKSVNSETVDTTTISLDKVRKVRIGYHLFVFNNVGELLSDKFISTYETKSLFHTVLFKDDGFYCTARGGTLQQQLREYNLQGEMVNQFVVGDVPTQHHLQISNDAIYFYGRSALNDMFETAYKSISKYSLDGTFKERFNWDYNGNNQHIKQGDVHSIYVDNGVIYYNGSYVSDTNYAVIGKLNDATSIAVPPALLSSMLYPNPTSDQTTITLELPQASQVHISLHDIFGIELQQIHNAFADAGAFTKSFTTNTLPKGVYYLKIYIGGDVKVEKVIVN